MKKCVLKKFAKITRKPLQQIVFIGKVAHCRLQACKSTEKDYLARIFPWYLQNVSDYLFRKTFVDGYF